MTPTPTDANDATADAPDRRPITDERVYRLLDGIMARHRRRSEGGDDDAT